MEVQITNENFEALKNEELAAEFGIRNIPTILFFKGGAQVDKLVGAQSKAKFEEKIEALL